MNRFATASVSSCRAINPTLIGSMTQVLQIGKGKVRLLDPPEPQVCRDCGTTFLRSQTRVVLCNNCRDANKLQRAKAWSKAALADPEKNAEINSRRRELNSSPEAKERLSVLQKERRANETPEQRERRLLKMREDGKKNAPKRRAGKYGLTPKQVDELLARQSGRCAICPTTEPAGRHKKWAIDHCHISGKVRGLLCHHCNTALGGFKDNPLLLQKAISYLNGNNRSVVAAVLHASDEGAEHGGVSDASSNADSRLPTDWS